MKTLYININNENISSNDELEVLNYDLDSDFFFYIGEKIASGCKQRVNENSLITDFNTQENDTDYVKIIEQWNELKAVLFSENPKGENEFYLPEKYIDWLRYNDKEAYRNIYEKKFAQSEYKIVIDIEELYEDSIESLIRRINRFIAKDDNANMFDEIVFNDDTITRKSPIVRILKEKYENIGFKAYKKWLVENEEKKNSGECNNTSLPTDDIFIEALKEHNEKWVADYYSKEGNILKCSCELIGEDSNFIRSEGIYYYIKNYKIIEISLDGCKDAKVVDEENAYFEYLILKNKSGFFIINNEGQILIPTGLYCDIKYACDDCVLVKKGNLWGVVSMKNEILIDFKYDKISLANKRISPNKKYFSFIDSDGYVGIIDEKGNIVISPEYENIECLVGNDNSVWFKICQNAYYGIMDEFEDTIIPLEYDEIEMLFDYVDRNEPLSPFFKVELNNESGVINSEGEFVIPLDHYEEIDFEIRSKNCIIAHYEDEYKYDWKNGTLIWINYPYVYEIPDNYCKYDVNGLRIYTECPSPLKTKQNYSLKNRKGDILYSSYCDDFYENGNPYGHHGECYIEEQRNGDDSTFVIIGRDGKVLGKVPKGYRVLDFVDGMALCINDKKNKTCIINLSGKILIELNELTSLPSFNDGKLFCVDYKGNVFYYDRSFSKTITCHNNNIEQLLYYMDGNMLSVKTKGGNLGLLDYSNGNLIEFEGVERIENLYRHNNEGHNIVKGYFLLYKNREYTLIDKYGNIIISNAYNRLEVLP